MTTAIIITFCSLLLIAYVFNLTATKTKIPSVLLLLLLGWVIKELTVFLAIPVPMLTPILPVLATIGLILMVLEGALELELNASKVTLITKSFLGALLPMIALSLIICYAFQYLGHYSFKDSLINAIPFCIISSAIAIPSIRGLNSLNREFVIYESSFSDIIGIVFFNFIMRNEVIDATAFGFFGLQLVIIIFVSFVATVGLSFLLSKIDHHVKFLPIILLVILIYTVLKEYHLPALIFILLFGLALSNLEELKRFKWIQIFGPEGLKKEIVKFRDLTMEGAFLIRALFFILFGYLLETSEVLNSDTLILSVSIVILIILIRIIQLKISGLPIFPLLFVAPRGLITILLFISIGADHLIPFVNQSVIIQVIILTTIIMSLGLIATPKSQKAEKKPIKET